MINPVGKVARIAHDHGALVHCDVSQAAGKIPVDAAALDLDFVTFTAHKMYGSKGCGAVVATEEARVMMDPLIRDGGGQQGGMRGGTLHVPGIMEFGVACRLILEGLQDVPRQSRP